MRITMLAAMLTAFCASGASAQSFDCAKASIATEFTICDSARLSRLDQEMSALYFALPFAARENIKSAQRRWLRRRNACGYDQDCIARAYRRRIDELAGDRGTGGGGSSGSQ